MSGFSKDQTTKLLGDLDPSRIHTREIEGRKIDYIEGWYAISEANAIFGHAGWDREMVHCERVFERIRGERTSCAYYARIRIRVRAGTLTILREGTGFGQAYAATPGDAHERALKAAETDATKRALATFGNRFGLGLYDKDHGAQRNLQARPDADSRQQPPSFALHRFMLRTEDGTVLSESLSPEGFCSGLRQLAEHCGTATEIEALRFHNREMIARLRDVAPSLKTASGKHYADILEDVMTKRVQAFMPPEPMIEAAQPIPKTEEVPQGETVTSRPTESLNSSKIALGPAINKSMLAFSTTRRIRNRSHLLRVGAQPCSICEDTPSHAHHVTFAQPRGLSVKVSDEFTVPLCASHHNEVHRSGYEEAWWRKYGVDPLAVAERLWRESLAIATPETDEKTGEARE